MAVLKCEVCGGQLELNQDMTIGVCQYCDAINVIPKDIEKQEKLYNYATNLRLNNEFDRAIRIYDDILKEDEHNAEAHWGLLLSKLAIEYVKDPSTGKRMPTCHRTEMGIILDDMDYKAVLEYSTSENRVYYEEKAKLIYEIQCDMIGIMRDEASYDVFICYKELDGYSQRTEDSILAQDIYEALKKKGYRVFFARKTLEHKLGKAYEPYICAALNSAKVMIVVGTKKEYLESVWVRNEWSRFYRLAQEKSSGKEMILAFKNLLPEYEAPAELSVLQGQDMTVIGAIHNLCDGVDRIIGENRSNSNASDGEVNDKSGVNRLIKNGETYLKLKNYAAAEDNYKELTKRYPEIGRGWWGLIVSKTKNFSVIVSNLSDLNFWFQSARTLYSSEQFQEYEKQYVDYLQKVAKIDAIKEINRVDEQLKEYKSHISALERKISDCNSQKVENDRLCQKEVVSRNEQISNLNADKEKQNQKMSSLKTRKSAGGVVLAAGIIFCFIALSNPYSLLNQLLFLVGGIGAIYLGYVLSYGPTYSKTKKRLEGVINGINQSISRIESEKKEKEQYFKYKTASLNREIIEYETQLDDMNQDIESCLQYLKNERDAIDQLHFARHVECVVLMSKVEK